VRFTRREFLAGAATMAAVGTLPAAALALNGTRPKCVILVDLDGFDPGYLGRAPAPNLDALASRGSLSIAGGTFHTLSNPSRASMSTGAHPEIHGNAAYFFNEATNRAVGQGRLLRKSIPAAAAPAFPPAPTMPATEPSARRLTNGTTAKVAPSAICVKTLRHWCADRDWFPVHQRG
jgi:hypothetical protein